METMQWVYNENVSELGLGNYTLKAGTNITITETKYTNGTIKSIKFTFNNSVGTSCKVEYLVNELYYIDGHDLSSTTINSTVNSVCITGITLKSYSSTFG